MLNTKNIQQSYLLIYWFILKQIHRYYLFHVTSSDNPQAIEIQFVNDDVIDSLKSRARVLSLIARALEFSRPKLLAMAALRQDFRSFVEQFSYITLHQA